MADDNKNLLPAKERFPNLTRNEISSLLNERVSANTNKSTILSMNIFKEYLRHKGLEDSDESLKRLTKFELNDILSLFYCEARTKSGDHYKLTSLRNCRYGINRFYNDLYTRGEIRAPIDIIKDPMFHYSNEIFRSMVVELKRLGKAAIDEHEEIVDDDLEKLYNYFRTVIDTPRGLYEKVLFDLLLHMCRRGMENLRDLTPSHFKLEE